MSPELIPVQKHLVVISGFRQYRGRRNGLLEVFSHLESRFPTARVWFEQWDNDMEGLAETIWAMRAIEQTTEVYVFAYSWGGGWAFPRLAKELKRRGMVVDHAVLCDPVFRSGWLGLRWLSLVDPNSWLGQWVPGFDWVKTRVPDNVREVTWFYQQQNRPRSQGVEAVDPQKTTIHDGTELLASHEYIDERAEFFNRCMEVAGGH